MKSVMKSLLVGFHLHYSSHASKPSKNEWSGRIWAEVGRIPWSSAEVDHISSFFHLQPILYGIDHEVEGVDRRSRIKMKSVPTSASTSLSFLLFRPIGLRPHLP